METKLQITNQINEAFLRMSMNAKKTGFIQITRSNEIGKYICSRLRYSNLPVRQSSGIIIHLPYYTLESGNSYYLYFTVEDQKKINDFLASEFNRFFRNYMLIGAEYNIQKKILLEAFIADLNLQNNSTVYQNLKKSDYRNRKKMTEFVKKAVQSVVL
ncbi:MAG: hypothetical protein QM503_10660 [Bacteroidota bacterium]